MLQELWEILSPFLDLSYVKKLLEENQFAQGGLVTGIAAAIGTFLWVNIKAVPRKVSRWIDRWTSFVVTIQQQNNLYDIVADFIINKYPKQLRNVEGFYGVVKNNLLNVDEIHDRSSKTDKTLGYLQYQDTYYILWKGRPMKVSKYREKLEGAMEVDKSHKDMITIKSFFGKKHIQSFLEKAVSSYEKKQDKKFVPKCYTPDYRYWQALSSIGERKLETIISKNTQVIKEDLDKFLSNREWYIKRGINYTRGYLLYGSPGNGKSSLIRALASYLKRDIYYMNLNDVGSDGKLQMLMSNLPEDAILVVEDIDSFYDKRKKEDSKLNSSFSAFINSLDGVATTQGLVTIITTNLPDKLDPALLRAGRMDVKLEFGNPSKEEALEYIRNFYDDPYLEIEDYVDRSFADLQNLCITTSKENISLCLSQKQQNVNGVS